MAFFSGQDEELKRLKKQLAQQDLNITHLQQEKTTLSQSLEEARRTCTEAVQKLTAETERVLRSEEQLNRLRAESSKQVIKITNLESVLQAAQERERLSARSTRELELQLGDFNGRASAGEAEKRRVLEDKVRSLESELKKMEGDLERERSKGAGAAEQGMDWGAPVGRARNGTRNADPATRAIALENQVIALRAENERLQKAASTSAGMFSPSTSRNTLPPSEASAFFGGPSPKKPTANGRSNMRRPRSSSVTGGNSDLKAVRLEAENEELKHSVMEAQKELTNAQARVTKAERDLMKAENEKIALERSAAKDLAEVRAKMADVKDELGWRDEEIRQLKAEVRDTSAARSSAEDKLADAKHAYSTLEKELSDARASADARSTRSTKQTTAAADARSAELEKQVGALKEQLQRCEDDLKGAAQTAQRANEAAQKASSALTAAEAKAARAEQQLASLQADPTSAADPSVTPAPTGVDRAARELKRELQTVQHERDTLRKEVSDLEDELERAAKASPSETIGGDAPTALNTTDDAAATARIAELEGIIDGLEAELNARTSELGAVESARDVAERDAAAVRGKATDDGAERDVWEKEMAELLEEREKARAEKRKIKMEFELYRGEMEAFSSQRDSLESECADLKEQVQRAEESLASAKMEIASAQSNAQEQVDAIRAQLQAAETRASAAKSQLVSLEQDAKDARADMREHQLRADELAERLESAGSRSHDDDEVQAICAERDQARTELDALNARVSTLETEVFGAQQEAEHAQEARDALKREVEELKSSMDVASQSKDSNESTLAERIELLETQLEHKKEELAAKEKDLDSVHDIAQQLGLQLAQSEEKIAVLEHAVKEQDIEMDVLRTNDAQNPETETKLEQLREEASQREAVLANALQSLHKRESELSAGKRQLQKLSASLQSAAAGPSRSSSEKMGLAHLQAAHLLESPSLFASPGGRPLVRDFEEDIFDEIEHVRDSWEVVERRLDFIRVEDGMKLAAAESEAKQLAERIQELEGQLIERSEAVESARRESEDALVARDGQIRTLEEELRGLQNEIESLAAKLAAMPEASVEEANSASETGNKAEWEELSLRLTAAEDRAAHMSNLWETLEGKRARLQDIETKRAAVSHVESRTDLHGEALERLERQRAEYADDAEKWMQEAHEVAAHLITSQARVGVLEQQLLETSTALDAARSGAQDGVQAGEPNTQFETKARELQEALAATQAELAQSKEAETAAQEALQLVSKEKATLAEQLADLETELQEMDSSHSAGESIREELAERARRFEEDLGIVTAREQEQASELDVARERIVAMEEASKQLEAGLAAAEQAHQNASGELEEARAQLAAKRLEVENAAYELAAATSADKLHQEEIKHLAAQLEHLQRDMSIDDAISAAADLKRQNAELEARVLRRTEQIGQQQRDLECERTNRTLAEETCEELNEEKAELEERIDTLEAQVREKNDAMLAAEEKVKALEEELSKVKELATVAEQDLLARQEELGTTKQLKAEAEATLEQAKQEAQSHHETVLQLERQLADSESRVGELVAASEAAGNESSERISALQAELREFVDARAELDSELHAARAHALSLDGTSQQRTEEVQQLQESITNLQEALNTMMADADARLVEEEMLRASLQQSDDQLASVRDELKVAREAADERASEVEHLHQSLAAAQTDLEDARSALVGAQESGEEDATRLAAAAQKEAELRGEIDYLQASLEDSLQSLEARKADVSRFEEAVSTMRAELEAARAALETVDGSTAEQKTELERLKFAESGAEAALQERVQALAATTEALTSTHKELQIKNQSLTQLTTELEAARSESSTRQEKIKELENELLAAEAQRREAGEVHAAALTAAEALHSERDALQAEVQQLQGELEALRQQLNDAFSRAAASKAQDAAGVEASEQQLQEELAALRIAKEELETNFNLKQTEVDELAAAHAEFEKNLQNAHAQATVAMDKLEDAHRQQLDVLHTEKTELENRLDGADGEHRKQVMELENQTESLRKQLAESLTALETSQGESQATLVNLEDVEARLQRANDNVASYSKRIEELETECSAHTTQYQNALVEADASKAELSAQHEQTVNQLSATIESLRAEHDTAVQELRKELDAASQHASEIAKNSETLAEKEEALHHMRESLDVLADRFNALEKEYDDVLADRDSILSRAAQSEDVHREELGKIHSSLEEATARLQQFAELEEALAERDERLAALEEVLGKRTAQMEERNAEYWAAREELAELQEQAERSREIRSTVEDLEARLQLSEESAATTAARAHELEKMRAQMQHANTEVRTLTERCAGQERELEELRDQVERAIAIQKFSEEEIKKFKNEAREMEAEVLEQQLHVKRALEDIQSLQTVEQRLLAELESARAAGPTQEDAEEMAYLSSRITELENELTAKAQEIEDADTKILDYMKQNKKSEAKAKSLASKVEALQKQLQQQSQVAAAPPSDAPLPLQAVSKRTSSSTEAAISPTPTNELPPMPRSTSRKRNSPEDVVEPVAGTPESSVRPMYVPSPHKNASGFTPIRRHKTKSMSSVAGAGPAVPSSLRSEVLPEGPALPDGESGSKTRVSSRNFSNPSDLVSALYPDDDRRSPERQERTIQKEANSGHRERALGGTLNDRTNVAGQNQSLGAVASKPSIAHEVTKQPAASDTAAAGQAAGLMARLASIRQGRA